VELTPNHPVQSLLGGQKNAGSLSIGEPILAYDPAEKRGDFFTLVEKTEFARGRQKVYNIETDKGTTLVVNNVVVLQK
jgi:hypothetical protein